MTKMTQGEHRRSLKIGTLTFRILHSAFQNPLSRTTLHPFNPSPLHPHTPIHNRLLPFPMTPTQQIAARLRRMTPPWALGAPLLLGAPVRLEAEACTTCLDLPARIGPRSRGLVVGWAGRRREAQKFLLLFN